MLTPLRDRVLIRPDEEPDETESGIKLVRRWKDAAQSGEVEAVGDERLPWCICDGAGSCLGCLIDATVHEAYGKTGMTWLKERRRIPRRVEIGDRVCFTTSAGQEVTVDGELFIVLKEEDLLAKVRANGE